MRRLRSAPLAPAAVLTPWLPATARPVREGVYSRAAPAGPYACWSGSTWYGDAASAAAAAARVEPSAHQSAAWRGLSSPPETPCFACKGHTVIDRGVDPETQRDLIEECPEC